MLDDLERDALTELVNIGVSRAAVSLRKLVRQKIALSVPAIELMSSAQAAAVIWQREGNAIVAVAQTLSGAFPGRGMLIFPADSGSSLAKVLIGDVMGAGDFKDLEDEALAETGNIVLNACFGSMGNMLEKRIHLSTPSVMRGVGMDLFDHMTSSPDGVVLFLYINFLVDQLNVRGYIALMMDMPSLRTLKEVIGNFVDRALGAAS